MMTIEVDSSSWECPSCAHKSSPTQGGISIVERVSAPVTCESTVKDHYQPNKVKASDGTLPQSPFARAWKYFQFGKLLYKSKRHSKALHCFHQSLRLCPNFCNANALCAILLCELDRLEPAEQHLLRAIRSNSDIILNALVNLSTIYTKQSQFHKALEAAKLAIKLDRRCYHALMNFNTILSCIGRKELATQLQWLELLLEERKVYVADETFHFLFEGIQTSVSHFDALYGLDTKHSPILPTVILEAAAEYAHKRGTDALMLNIGKSQVFNVENRVTTQLNLGVGGPVLTFEHPEHPPGLSIDAIKNELSAAFEMLCKHKQVMQIDCNAVAPQAATSNPLKVVCVKWGQKYSASYVNNLCLAVRKHLNVSPLYPSYEFVCFTDDPCSLLPSISIELIAGPEVKQTSEPNDSEASRNTATVDQEAPTKGWWSKLNLFRRDSSLQGSRCLYFDLDTIIVGDISSLAAYSRNFGVLSSRNIRFDTAVGYNSSILSWVQDADTWSPLIERFTIEATHCIHRLDHWLEMMVVNADYIDMHFEGTIVDYGDKVASTLASAKLKTVKTIAKDTQSLSAKCAASYRPGEGSASENGILKDENLQHMLKPSSLGLTGNRTGSSTQVEVSSLHHAIDQVQDDDGIENALKEVILSSSIIIFAGKTKPSDAVVTHSWLREYWDVNV